jgi:ubiquinone/menaquinone biosynthesis C-methylase UbiE
MKIKKQIKMGNIIYRPSIYKFLRFTNESSLEKTILDCGAGGRQPLIALFKEQGYKTCGIEISESAIRCANEFAEKHNIGDLNIQKGDMRKLPYKEEFFSFVYSYHTIFHLQKNDVAIAMREMLRVLKKNGLCFVNFLWVEDSSYGRGEEVGVGEYYLEEAQSIHSYFEDDEPGKYFSSTEIIYKEKSIISTISWRGEPIAQGYIEYIARK